jgi:hypothetical protein
VETINSSDYEGMAASYQCVEIDRLNSVLKEKGIDDVELRKLICEQYFFHAGVFLDSGWLISDGKKVWPQLCFAEQSDHTAPGRGDIHKLHIPSDHFAFHEYVHGDSDVYFEDNNEDLSDIEHGYC